jgi:hypothetical protein
VLIDEILRSDSTNVAKIDTLLSLARGTSSDGVYTKEIILGIVDLISTKNEKVAFLNQLIVGEESSSMICAAIQLLAQQNANEMVSILIEMWHEEKREDVLESLSMAINQLWAKKQPSPNLMSIGSASFIAKKYDVQYDDILDIFSSKQANLALLKEGLKKKPKTTTIPMGTFLIISTWENARPKSTNSFITTEEFEGLILNLSLTFREEESGAMMCMVSESESEEVVDLLFESNVGAAFWVCRG